MGNETERQAMIRWARDLVVRHDWVIFDTETTGLYGADIVQAGVVSVYGHVLLDALVLPMQPITPGAHRVHKLQMEHLDGAISFLQLYPLLAHLFHERLVLIYNAQFDVGILNGMCRRAGLLPLLYRHECVMHAYAVYCGELRHDGAYRWQRLPNGDHSAIGDCRAVWRLLHEMAASPLPDDPPAPVLDVMLGEDFPF